MSTINVHNLNIDELNQQLNQQKLINEFAKEILTKDSVQEILWAICSKVIAKLNFEDCVIYLVDKEREVLVQAAAYGPKNPICHVISNRLTIPIGKGVVGSVAANGVAEIVSDTSLDRRYILDDQMRYSEIAVPIICDGEVIAIIDSEHPQKNFFNKDHLAMLESIATLCASRIAYALKHEELQQHKKQLELIVEGRTEQLKEVINRLKRSNKNLEKYAFMVSHDLKSPLKTISAFSKLISKSKEHLSDDQIEYLEVINSAARKMNQLLEETLITSLNEKSELSMKEIDLDEVFLNVKDNLHFDLESNEIEIIQKNSLPKYWGIESHFVQIFQNLISNSIKYRIPEEKQRIIITTEKIENAIKLVFQDFGIGVKQKFIKSIFDLGERRYFEVNGNGIGLHTCKSIVRYYNGRIWADSDGENQGLTINILLPL